MRQVMSSHQLMFLSIQIRGAMGRFAMRASLAWFNAVSLLISLKYSIT